VEELAICFHSSCVCQFQTSPSRCFLILYRKNDLCNYAIFTHARMQHMHARTHACTHARARTHAHARTHARTHACTHTCTHTEEDSVETGQGNKRAEKRLQTTVVSFCDQTTPPTCRVSTSEVSSLACMRTHCFLLAHSLARSVPRSRVSSSTLSHTHLVCTHRHTPALVDGLE